MRVRQTTAVVVPANRRSERQTHVESSPDQLQERPFDLDAGGLAEHIGLEDDAIAPGAVTDNAQNVHRNHPSEEEPVVLGPPETTSQC